MARTDRELKSLIEEIRSNTLDLNPDFQRGEVWKPQKQQLLIDTILRGWYIPPIHVVEHEDNSIQEILDGQQRLRSIMNFVNGLIAVDGQIEPFDTRIYSLNGLRFHAMPESTKLAFQRFSITQYTLNSFTPPEPAELFFRLNQNLPLTPAETRNAFIGEPREQVKELVQALEQRLPQNAGALAFSNARMSYDDVLARFCLALDRGTLTKRITARDLDQRYRSGEPFDHSTILQAQSAISFLARAISYSDTNWRLNKATLFSWLWFASSVSVGKDPLMSPAELSRSLEHIENQNSNKGDSGIIDAHLLEVDLHHINSIYYDRSTSRVADVSSVVLRDLVIWITSAALSTEFENNIYRLESNDIRKRRFSLMTSLAKAKHVAETSEILNELILLG